MRIVCRNVTTNELINWHRYPGWTREDGSFVNPYDRGVVHNVRQATPPPPWQRRGPPLRPLAAAAAGAGHRRGHGEGEGGAAWTPDAPSRFAAEKSAAADP